MQKAEVLDSLAGSKRNFRIVVKPSHTELNEDSKASIKSRVDRLERSSSGEILAN